jgi:hypothetical protein
MGIVIKMVDPISVEKACAPDQAVDFVTLLKQKLGKIGAVLSCNSSDQRTFRDLCQSSRLSIASLLWNLRSTKQLMSGGKRESSDPKSRKLTIPLGSIPVATMGTIDHISGDNVNSSVSCPAKRRRGDPAPSHTAALIYDSNDYAG